MWIPKVVCHNPHSAMNFHFQNPSYTIDISTIFNVRIIYQKELLLPEVPVRPDSPLSESYGRLGGQEFTLTGE